MTLGNMRSLGPRSLAVSCELAHGVHMLWHHRRGRAAKLARASRAAKPHGNAMAKLKMPSDAATALSAPERLLLLCVASGIDFKHAKIAERVATEMVVKGLISRDAGGVLTLTDRGRAVLRAMLPEL
jgi:hypothetical protein